MKQSKLQRIISESVRRVIRETEYSGWNEVYETLEELQEVMSDTSIITSILSRLGNYEALKILNDIKSTDLDDEFEE